MTAPLFAFDHVLGGYGGSTVVRGVSGTLSEGQVLCILGRNGVGKSTLLKLLYGFLPLDDGDVRFRGGDISHLAPAVRSSTGISYCPQERIVFDDLTVGENLTLMQPRPDLRHFASYFARFPRLEERLSQHAGTLSGGERKLLSLTRALGEDRPLLLIDEPTEGVQQENVIHMAALVEERKHRGTGFVIVEQNLEFVEAVADAYLVLDQGRTVLEGPRADIARTDLVAHLTV